MAWFNKWVRTNIGYRTDKPDEQGQYAEAWHPKSEGGFQNRWVGIVSYMNPRFSETTPEPVDSFGSFKTLKALKDWVKRNW